MEPLQNAPWWENVDEQWRRGHFRPALVEELYGLSVVPVWGLRET